MNYLIINIKTNEPLFQSKDVDECISKLSDYSDGIIMSESEYDDLMDHLADQLADRTAVE